MVPVQVPGALWTQMSSGQGKLQATEPELVQEQLMAARPVSAQAQAQLPAAVLGSAQAQGLQLQVQGLALALVAQR